MLKFYYHPLSPVARRVWLALLEKELPFEQILVNLAKGEQRTSSYLDLNVKSYVSSFPAVFEIKDSPLLF